MRNLFSLGILVIVFSSFQTNSADTKVYMRPIFGLAVPIKGGDASYAVGGALGYNFNGLAIETSYTRLIATGSGFDNNLVEFAGQYSFPMPSITPFVKAGGGFYKLSVPGIDTGFNGFIEFGGGTVLNFFPFIDIGVGLSYMALFDSKDLVYPFFYLGIGI